MPCKPMSPKPWSPRPAAWWAEFHYPGRGSAISMVSLGSYRNVDSSSPTPERPKTPKARTSLLHSLQTLDQDNQKEARGENGQHHCGLSTAPLLRDLPGSENHMPWEEQPGKKPSCSLGQKAFHIEPAQRPFSTTEMVTWTLPSVSAENVPRETPPQRRSMPQHSHSLDDLWLEKTQRRKLKKQVQLERKMHGGTAHKDGVQCWRKMTVTSPESLNFPRRSHPFSHSAPTGLNHLCWPEYLPDTASSSLQSTGPAYPARGTLLPAGCRQGGGCRVFPAHRLRGRAGDAGKSRPGALPGPGVQGCLPGSLPPG
ncbi:PREDICTED: uncharacterized protein LOC106800816 [Ceratotherium simum simum]|uniref:Uncharacterized protein LOC106800816 n=1 Tax=Ceratotherium simum simum TaxID=73337 RepID=A0ABM1CEB8_CERSS|nr:PREDICTED: uncharacterized protein LOC106800816 [Ceratotherium simum simum]